MTWFVVLMAAVVGACVGSFLGVVFWRVPRGESILHPPSHCTDCGVRLAPSELIPVFSWLAAQGHCRHCGARIPVSALALELGTAAVFVGVVLLVLG